jgi:hypothetical protein
MRDLGYETHNSVRLLGSLFIFSAFYFLRVMLFYPIVKLYVRMRNKGIEYKQKLRDQLFYGELILISIESYIELLIAGYLNVKYKLNSTGGERMAIWVSYYCLIMCLVAMPLLSIYILTRDIELFHDERFEIKFGAFWEGIRKDSKAELGYNAVFMFRRAVFVGISFLLF